MRILRAIRALEVPIQGLWRTHTGRVARILNFLTKILIPDPLCLGGCHQYQIYRHGNNALPGQGHIDVRL